MKKEFELLIMASVNLCHQMGYTQTIYDCERVLLKMKKGKSGPIDMDKIDLEARIINEFIANNELVLLEREGWREGLEKNLN